MIELVILRFLNERLDCPVFLEYPQEDLSRFVLFEKTSGAEENYLKSATFAFQSYAPSLYETAVLNEEVKKAVKDLIVLDEIRGLSLNSDYNFTDVERKRHRYQAVFDIKHY